MTFTEGQAILDVQREKIVSRELEGSYSMLVQLYITYPVENMHVGDHIAMLQYSTYLRTCAVCLATALPSIYFEIVCLLPYFHAALGTSENHAEKMSFL